MQPLEKFQDQYMSSKETAPVRLTCVNVSFTFLTKLQVKNIENIFIALFASAY